VGTVWSRVLIVTVAVIAVAGVAAAATAVVWFVPQQEGTYSGPGAPQTTAGNCTLPGQDHWCSQGFGVSSVSFNVTMCFMTNTTTQAGVVAYLMNDSSYHNFTVNSTLTHLDEVPSPRCFGPTAYDDGPGTFYWVWVDTTDRPIVVQYSIYVEATS
jgi:hypothetical protein